MSMLSGDTQTWRLLYNSCQPEPHITPLELLVMDYLMTGARLVLLFFLLGKKGIAEPTKRQNYVIFSRK